MSELPVGWAEATLGNLVSVMNGATPKGIASIDNGAIPFYKVADMNRALGHTMGDAGIYLDEPTVDRYRLRLAPPGAIIMPKVGGAIATNKKRLLRTPSTFDTNTFALVPEPPILPEFVFYWLQTVDLRDFAYGSPVQQVARDRLLDSRVLLPPAHEQRRIVAAIEEQFSRLDVGDLSLGVAKRRLEGMAPSVLVHALRDTDDRVRLDQVAEVRLGRQRSPKNHVGPNMRPYLRAANVTWNGLWLDDVKSMHFSLSEVENYELHEGDVLLSEASGSAGEVGKPALWRSEIPGCCFQNTLIRVRSRGPLPEFLRLVFLRDALTGKFATAAPGVGIHHLGSSRLARWEIPQPPLDEQRRIIAEVERELSIVDAMAAQIDNALRRSAALRRSILERAFSGKLRAQDPDDVPAVSLLERIAAERGPARKASRQRVGIRT